MRLLKIGKDPQCDIVVNASVVSGLHAEILLMNNGDILLEDKHSTNGTFVNGQRIKPGAQVSVRRGDLIQFGNVDLIWNQVPQLPGIGQYKRIYGIGNSMKNEINASGNTVSRYHATLKIDKKGHAFIEDHSKNGTTVNGNRINKGNDHRIKRGDAVAVGGVPVNLSQFIPGSKLPMISGIVATVIVLLVAGWGAWYVMKPSAVQPATTEALENASACVYGGFYYVIDVKDDPFKNVLNNWPQKWYAGISKRTGKIDISPDMSDLDPLEYYGTAFFISPNGEMGTNRHVAVPWEYRTAEEEEKLKQEMQKILNANQDGFLMPILVNAYQMGKISGEDANAWLMRLSKSPIDISGQHAYFGVGLTGSKINSQLDLQQAQVIAESGDDKKDVALIRLNSRKTPDHLVKMGAYYNLSDARTDESTLKPQEDELVVIGYPMGEVINNESFDGKELRPTIHKTSLSKVPDVNTMQIQTVGIGGQSGSPVSDKNHRLVGVLCSGFRGTEVTYACNIRHLVDLYNANKTR